MESASRKRTKLAGKTEELQSSLQRAETDWEQLRTRHARLQNEADVLRAQAEEMAAYRPEQTDPVIKGLGGIVKARHDLQNKCTELQSKLDSSAQRWEEQQSRFAALQMEQKNAQSAWEEQRSYAPEKADPAIKALEESQKLSQLGSVKEQELSAGQLKADELSLLAEYSGALPDPAEGDRMRNLCRKNAACAADLQGLQAKLDGEQSRADSLHLSAEQIEVGQAETPPEVPAADRSVLFFAAGAVILVLGILLAVLVHPALAVLTAVGIVVIVLGVTGKQKFQHASEAFADYQAREAKRQEAAVKKEALLEQLRESEASADALRRQLADRQASVKNDRETVKRWLAGWMPDIPEPVEADITALLDQAGKVRSLREKQRTLADWQQEREAFLQREQEQRRLADKAYPELAHLPAAEMLEAIRSGETEYRIREKQAAAAEQALETFLKKEKLTLQQLSEPRSPEQSVLEQALRGAEEQLAHAADPRKAWEQMFPEIAGLSEEDASAILREKQSSYQVRNAQQRTAENAVSAFLKSIKRSAKDLLSETSPELPALQKQLAEAKQQITDTEAAVQQVIHTFPEIQGKTADDAVTFLRERLRAYQITDGQLCTAQQAKQKFLKSCRYTAQELEGDTSPKLAELSAGKDAAVQKAERIINTAVPVLAAIHTDPALTVPQQMEQAERMLDIYRSHAEKLADLQSRQQKHQGQLAALQAAFNEKSSVLQGLYPEAELSVRLAAIREDLEKVSSLTAKQNENRTAQEQTANALQRVQKSLTAYLTAHTGFQPDSDDVLAEIDRRAEEYRKLESAAAALEKQRQEVQAKMDSPAQRAADVQEAGLRREIVEMENKRDALLTEYTKKGEQIRSADRSLEQFADSEILIRELYEKKEHIQNELKVLHRAKQLIEQAKENLAEQYLGKVEQCFNRYMQLWLENPALSGILDTDFRVSISENGASHVAEGYSTGYCDLIDFCMRLALVDTLFVQEQPFLILDDPFVNLDDVRTEKALELLRMMSETRQI